MVEEMVLTSGALVTMAVLAGLKLAIATILLVYAYLADVALGKRKNHWLNFVAIIFMIMAIGEFLHIFGDLGASYVIWTWLAPHENLATFINVLFLPVAIGILFFFRSILKNIKEYR